MFRKPPLPTPSSATYVRLPAAPRPRPATPRAAESEAAVAAAATAVSSSSSGCAVIRSCEPSTGGDRASSTVLGFPAGRSRAAGRADSEAAGRAPSEGQPGPPRTSPRAALRGSPGPPRRDPRLPSPAPRGPACSPACLRDPRAIVPRKPWARPWRPAPFSTWSAERIY